MGATIQIEALGLDDAGHGVGRAGELWVHAGDWLPGERVEVRLDHRSPHRPHAWGTALRQLGPASPDRVAPSCPAFGQCGGCVWQHLAYPAQLRAKRERVERALAEALTEALGDGRAEGRGGAPGVEAVRAAPAAVGYRNKGKYVIGLADGRLTLGAYAPRTHRLVDTLGCAVVDPAIGAAARGLRQALEQSGLAPYDESTRTGYLRYAILRTTEAGELLVAVVATRATPRAPLTALAEALVGGGAAAGVTWVRNDHTGGVLLTDDIEVLAGVGVIRERLSGVEVDVGPSDFFQVNREQAQRLYLEVAALSGAGPETRAVDVYCGLGGIAFALAAAGARVVGLEAVPSAVECANAAAERAALAQLASFRVGDAAALAAIGAELAPNLVVVNPPRKGLHQAALSALATVAPARLVYVSCGPESLGRDLRTLLETGYCLERVQPWDLMPGTPQVETVCLLTR